MPRVANLSSRPSSSNTSQSGMTGGTLGGLRSAVGNPAGNGFSPVYIWAMVIIEIGLIGVLRNHFAKRHGG